LQIVNLLYLIAVFVVGIWAAIWVNRRLSLAWLGTGWNARLGEISFRFFVGCIAWIVSTVPLVLAAQLILSF
jgi:hypothetical protein